MRSDSEEVRHKKTNRQKRSVCFFERSPAHRGKLEGKNTKLQQKGEGEERRETPQRRQQEGEQLKRPKEAKAAAGAKLLADAGRRRPAEPLQYKQ